MIAGSTLVHGITAFAALLLALLIVSPSSSSLFPASMALKAARQHNAGLSLWSKHAVVVGGTSGIGHGIALRLAKSGCTVTIVGRSERGIVEEMTAASAESAAAAAGGELKGEHDEYKPKHAFVSVNGFLLSSVDEAVREIAARHDKIDFLVQSQGMATLQGFTPSAEEGLDQKLALHVYSRAAFNRGLQPLLAKSNDPRSLSVLSAGIHSSYKNYETDPELSLGSYSIKNAADSAGFYNDIMADKFSDVNPDITYMHAAPGFVSTRWGTEMPAVIRWAVRGLQVFGRSKEDCAEYMVSGLTNPEHKGGFKLLDQYGVASAKVTNLHEKAKDFVFDHIMKVLDAGRAVATRSSAGL